jgi:hypothetical protein
VRSGISAWGRRRCLLVGVAWLALALVPSAGRSDPLAPEMLPSGDPAWEDLYLLELSGALPAGTTSMRPASRGEIASWIAGAADDPRADRESLSRLQRRFARELRRIGRPGPFHETRAAIRLTEEAASGDTLCLDGARSELRAGPTLSLGLRSGEGKTEFTDSTRVGLYGVYLIGKSVALQGELFVGEIEDGRSIGDPLINNTDILYFVEEVGASAATKDARFRLARGRHHWGAGWGRSLLLDGEAAPIDFFEWSLRLPKRLRFTSWSGSLNVGEERGIAAHRLEVPITEGLLFAIAEGVRFRGGPGHPLYLLGIVPYTLIQRLDWQDASADSVRMSQRNNVLAEAEVVWRPRTGSLVYAEFLADDIPAASGDMPARIGGRLGLAAMPHLAGAPLDVGIEGTKIARYTYSVYYSDDCECDWIHHDAAIGEPDGPDQEAIRLRVGRSLSRDHRIEMLATWANRGAGPLGEAWVSGGPDVENPTREALSVSPTVERERSLALRWRWDARDNLSLDAETIGVFLRNAGNQASEGWDERFYLAIRGEWRL